MKKFVIFPLLIWGISAAQAEEVWKTIPAPTPMPEAVSSGSVPINGIDMYYATYGDNEGTPILMIHGGLGHADLWSAQVADLSQDYRVIVADTRGHGRSTNDGSAYTIDLLASDYVALMGELGLEQVHLIGWSDGANIGFSLSQSNPELLASHFAHAGNVSLAGVDPGVNTNEVFGSYIGMMGAEYGRLSATPDDYMEFLGGLAAMWGSEKPGGLEALGSINVPTIIVHSEHDEAILQSHSEDMAAAIPGAKFVRLEGLSHFAALQDPSAYNAAIRNWLAAQ